MNSFGRLPSVGIFEDSGGKASYTICHVGAGEFHQASSAIFVWHGDANRFPVPHLVFGFFSFLNLSVTCTRGSSNIMQHETIRLLHRNVRSQS